MDSVRSRSQFSCFCSSLGSPVRKPPVDGGAVKSPTDLTRRIADVKVGEKVTLGVLRNGKMVTVVITAALRPGEDELAKGLNGGSTGSDDSASSGSASGAPVIGLSVKAITPDVRKTYSLDADVSGLLITDVDDSSQAGQLGLKPGDIIVLANNLPVTSQADFAKTVDTLKKANRPSILLLIRRDGRNVALPLSLKADATK